MRVYFLERFFEGGGGFEAAGLGRCDLHGCFGDGVDPHSCGTFFFCKSAEARDAHLGIRADAVGNVCNDGFDSLACVGFRHFQL